MAIYHSDSPLEWARPLSPYLDWWIWFRFFSLVRLARLPHGVDIKPRLSPRLLAHSRASDDDRELPWWRKANETVSDDCQLLLTQIGDLVSWKSESISWILYHQPIFLVQLPHQSLKTMSRDEQDPKSCSRALWISATVGGSGRQADCWSMYPSSGHYYHHTVCFKS